MELKLVCCPNCNEPFITDDISKQHFCKHCEHLVVPMGKVISKEEKIKPIKDLEVMDNYLESYFKNYNWDSFSIVLDYLVEDIETHLLYLQKIYNNEEVWVLSFKGLYGTLTKKIEGINNFLKKCITMYYSEDPNTKTYYDGYLNSVVYLKIKKSEIREKLQNYINNIALFKPKKELLQDLQNKVEEVINVIDNLETPNNINKIGMIVDNQKNINQEIIKQQANYQIDVEAIYQESIQRLADNNYNEALSKLVNIQSYKNVKEIIADNFSMPLVDNLIKVTNKYYYIKKEKEQINCVSDIKDQHKNKVLISKIDKVITRFGNKLYYICDNRLKMYDFENNQEVVIDGKNKYQNFVVDKKNFKFYLVQENTKKLVMFEFDEANDQITDLGINKVYNILYFYNDKIILNIENRENICYEINTNEKIDICDGKIKVNGHFNNTIIYEKYHENDSSIYLKELSIGSTPLKIEDHILNFERLIESNIYYAIGTNNYKTLVSKSIYGTNRRQLVYTFEKFLFKEGQDIYVLKGDKQLSLVKVSLNSNEAKPILSQVKDVYKTMNGFCYCITDNSCLVKINLNNDNVEVVDNNVEEIIGLAKDKIYYKAVDSKEIVDEVVKIKAALYSYSLFEGRQKLASNIINAAYDDEVIYYNVRNSDNLESYYAIQPHNLQLEKIVSFKNVVSAPKKQKKKKEKKK